VLRPTEAQSKRLDRETITMAAGPLAFSNCEEETKVIERQPGQKRPAAEI